MLAFWVVEQLDLREHVAPGSLSCPIGSAPDLLALEQLEKAFSDSVVMAITSPTQGMFEPVFAQEGSPFPAGILRALIGMD